MKSLKEDRICFWTDVYNLLSKSSAETEKLEFVLFGLSSISKGSISSQEHTVQSHIHSIQEARTTPTSTAAAAAKSLQSCPTLCDPIDGSPPGSPVPSPMHERKSESEVTQLCLTLSHPMDCSLPGSSVHGIFQVRVLEWGAIAFSPTSTNPIHSLANTLCFIVSTVNVRKGFYC